MKFYLPVIFLILIQPGLARPKPASPAVTGVKLLYYQDKGWLDPHSWIQLNVAVGQIPLNRVPTNQDDVVFSKNMSGISDVLLQVDTIFVGSSHAANFQCRSIHISGTHIQLPQNVMGYGTVVSVTTSNGGHVIIDSGSLVEYGLFELHGGDSALSDLDLNNSTLQPYFSHGVSSYIKGYDNSVIRIRDSKFSGFEISSGKHTRLTMQNAEFNTTKFIVGDSSSILMHGCKIGSLEIGNIHYLDFGIGKNSRLVSADNIIYGALGTSIYTSGQELTANVIPGAGTQSMGLKFIQADTMDFRPNILNGSVTMPLDYGGGLGMQGDLWLSGNLQWISTDGPASNDSTRLVVNGISTFLIGGVTNFTQSSTVRYCPRSFCHYKLVFYGDHDANIFWPIGFPVDTLVINKSQCARVTSTKGLYVAGEAQIKGGQLVLSPVSGERYSYVCAGNTIIENGGGLFLNKDSLGNGTNIIVTGKIEDKNRRRSSDCAGFINPYDGEVLSGSVISQNYSTVLSGRILNKAVSLASYHAGNFHPKYFEIERSYDRLRFLPLARISAVRPRFPNVYQYLDTAGLRGVNFYRLKIMDEKNDFHYSDTIDVRAFAKNELKIFPNPAGEKLMLNLPSHDGKLSITILNASGAIVKKEEIFSGNNFLELQIGNLPAGVYAVLLSTARSKEVARFVKN